MKNPSKIQEISAEMWLNLLYPEEAEKWIVKDKGTFYRNYTPDILSLDENTHEVSLSRDGFTKLLPQD